MTTSGTTPARAADHHAADRPDPTGDQRSGPTTWTTGPRGTRVVVVGAGLAGLAAACAAARDGARVTLLDARSEPGGRARTHRVGGALLNEGAHALYRDRGGHAVLEELGVNPTGGSPAKPVWIERGGALRVLPTSIRDTHRRSGLAMSAVLRVAGLLLAGRGPRATSDMSLREWIDRAAPHPDSRAVLEMLSRVATYCDEPDTLPADAAVEQMRSAGKPSVLYVDGGWGRIVDQLRSRAVASGVQVHTGQKATSVRPGGTVEVAAGASTFEADAVVIAAGGAAAAASLLEASGHPSAALRDSAEAARPVLATTLDLHLDRLPDPDRRVAFSLDRPLYFSVHTPSADLADSGEVVHMLRYGPHDESARAEIEAFADVVQPGWRDRVMSDRFGRSQVVAHDRPRPGPSVGHRIPPTIADSPGVWVAGDWVGPTGLLADAALTSGRAAGVLAARQRAAPQS